MLRFSRFITGEETLISMKIKNQSYIKLLTEFNVMRFINMSLQRTKPIKIVPHKNAKDGKQNQVTI